MRTIWTSFAFQLTCFALKPPPLKIISIQGRDPINAVEYPVFGLQDALNSFYNGAKDSDSITLFSKACGNQTQNCTAACLDPAQMFGNLETLHNCGVYQNVSELWAGGNLHAESISVLKDLGFKKSSRNSSLPSDINNAIHVCLLDICGDNPDCPNRTKAPYADICAEISAPVIADVAGIGVT